MHKIVTREVEFLLFLAVLIGLLPALAAAGREVVDQAGRRVTVPAEPARIVALAPSITEIIYALGQEAKLKGVTSFSDYPAAAASLPKVGSYVRLDLEKIMALRPDLCIASKDGNPKHIVDRIEALGIPVFVIDPRNLADIVETLTMLGDLLGAEDAASALGRDIQNRLERIKAKVRQAVHRPGVFFQVDNMPIFSVGTNTFIHELITLAGGRNLAAGPVDYPRYGWEEILVLQPEIVIMTSMAGTVPPAALISEWRRWPRIPAVRTGRVHVVDADLFGRPTNRLIDGLEVLVAIIHPELFVTGDRGQETEGRGRK